MDNGASSYLRFLNGDNDRFVDIVREYNDGLILFLNSIIKDIQIAEEAADDTLLKLGTSEYEIFRYNKNNILISWQKNTV